MAAFKALGLSPATGLAVSLLRRARQFAVSIVGVLVVILYESRHLPIKKMSVPPEQLFDVETVAPASSDPRADEIAPAAPLVAPSGQPIEP